MLLKDQTTNRNRSTNLQPGLPPIDWYAERGQVSRVAVKVIDERGNELMRVLDVAE